MKTHLHALLRGSLGAVLVVIMYLPATSNAVTACDRAAGHGSDPDSVVAGVEAGEMDFAAAESACRSAVADYPAHARSNYQLGRVLYYSGRGKEAFPYLKAAADAGYRQALFVLGFTMMFEGDGIPLDYCKTAELWTKSAALDHPWTGVYLPLEYLKGTFDDCDITLSDADLQRLQDLALQHIAYNDSEGRVEALQKLMQEHMALAKTGK